MLESDKQFELLKSCLQTKTDEMEALLQEKEVLMQKVTARWCRISGSDYSKNLFSSDVFRYKIYIFVKINTVGCLEFLNPEPNSKFENQLRG